MLRNIFPLVEIKIGEWGGNENPTFQPANIFVGALVKEAVQLCGLGDRHYLPGEGWISLVCPWEKQLNV